MLPLLRDATFRRFAVVGASNTALAYLCFILVLHLLGDLPVRGSVAQVVSYGTGVFWSYYWNRRWSFRSQGAVTTEMTRFLLAQLICLGISTALIGLAVDILLLPPTPSWLVVMSGIVILNFSLLKLWVFEAR